jgi:dihydrodipicolinate synthase/N-acetylneuraminate lyase
MDSAKRYPPVLLATCPVPWTPDYQLDTPLFQHTVRRLVAEMTPHVYVFGTAGEGHAVTDAQFEEITLAFHEALPPEAVPMVGVISLSQGTIVERIRFAYDLGIRRFQISLPSWGALQDAELDAFFDATCGAFPDCQFLHYNLPRAKRLLNGADYARLAAHHSNLVAVKMGGDPELLRDVLTSAPELQCFFVEFGYAALRDEFECGYIAAMTAGKPVFARRYHAARGEELAGMLAEVKTAHRALHDAVDACGAHMDGAYDKVNAKIMEADFPLRLLPPYTATSDEAYARFCSEVPASWLQP